MPVVPLFAHAACLGQDPDLSFPPQGKPAEEAKAICRTRLAREECLQYALAHPSLEGIWTGTTNNQRRRLRRTLVG